jgi:hypothetical protein
MGKPDTQTHLSHHRKFTSRLDVHGGCRLVFVWLYLQSSVSSEHKFIMTKTYACLNVIQLKKYVVRKVINMWVGHSYSGRKVDRHSFTMVDWDRLMVAQAL